MIGTINKSKYAELLAETLPSVIETEEENERVLETVNRLMDKGEGKLSPVENKLFALLVRLIEDFEEKAYPEIGKSLTPRSMLLFLMDQRCLKQKHLIDVFGSKGITSEVENGQRSISKNQARKQAEKFKVSAELFI
jgi:HTH-type transcriptional regulator/antitoxin HigA